MFPLIFIFLSIFSSISVAQEVSCYSETLDLAAVGSTNVYGIWSNTSTATITDWFITDRDGDWLYHLNTSGGNVTTPPGHCSTTTFASDIPLTVWSNATDSSPTSFWVLDASDDFLYHVNGSCSYSAGSDGNFSTSGFGAASPGAFWSNASEQSPTDFWVFDDADDFIYHVDTTGAYSAGTEFNCSAAAIGAASIGGLWSNDTNRTPEIMYAYDSTDDLIYVMNSTCGQIDTLNMSTWGAADARGIFGAPLGTAVTRLWIAERTDDEIYGFTERAVLGNASWSFSGISDSVSDNITILLTGSGVSDVDVCMPFLRGGSGLDDCTYNVTGATNLTLANSSLGCWANGTLSITTSFTTRVHDATALTFVTPPNIPAAIAITSIVTIVVIFAVDELRRRTGFA